MIRDTTVTLLVIGLLAVGAGERAHAGRSSLHPTNVRPSAGGGSAASAPTAEDVAALSHVVGRYAHATGEPAPKNGQLVVTTLGAATTKLLGYDDPDDAQPLSEPSDPVFVVRVSGDFVGNTLPHPPGFVPPHGKYQYFVFEAKTRDLRVFAISNRDEELSQVGAPQPFSVADS